MCVILVKKILKGKRNYQVIKKLVGLFPRYSSSVYADLTHIVSMR